MNVVAYLRVSTAGQADSGLGLDAQRRIIATEAARRGWTVVAFETDEGVSATATRRPALERALASLRAGDAEALVVAKLDRLARSTLGFAELLATAQREGFAVVALDLGVDMTTPSGRLVANVMACVAEWERDAIRARTKEALAAAKARGTRMGRPRQIDPALLARIVAMKATGLSHRSIAAALTAEGVPTPTGRDRWNPGSIGGYLASAALDPVPTTGEAA
ncbi:recombinase family protein [Blastococcus saxobsidens]|uniref:DNA invertase Pin-like site-specific DNA recombinase n=1 Tax=Blastococcus saxobsidens TaxID=138336 RepID=A0A4Q7Y3G3_9ACTN|nr:recombinase family protein [Blastococcus saxobsidens]RZU30621.1 DNA invertase Pin-like site-specific DNA recombinase [Blastococcus saxobsidens]